MASSKISIGLLGLDLEIKFDTAKLLGAVGAPLFLLGLFIPPVSMVGAILVLISLNYFSKFYKNPPIYTDYLYSGVLGVVASVLAPFGFFGPMSFMAGLTEELDIGDLLNLVIIAIPALIYALLLLGAMFFYYRALVSMAASSQLELFRYAGLSGLVGGGLMLAGALLLIVLIGFLFMLLSFLTLIASAVLPLVAFFQLKEPQPSPPPQPIAPAAPA